MGLYDMYDVPIANHLAGYNQDESIMPAIRNLLSQPIVEDTNMAALTGMNLPEIMNNAFKVRDNTLSTYGNLLKEDTSNYLKAPTAIKALSEAKENAGRYDPSVQLPVEQAKERGKKTGEYLATDDIATQWDNVKLHPELATLMGVGSLGEAYRLHGSNLASVMNALQRKWGDLGAAGIKAGGEKFATLASLQGMVLNNQLQDLDKEEAGLRKIVSDLIYANKMNDPSQVKMLDDANARIAQIGLNRRDLRNRLMGLAGTVGERIDRKVGKRPGPVKQAKTVNPDIPTAGTPVKTSKGDGIYTGRTGPNGHPTIMLGGKEYEYKK